MVKSKRAIVFALSVVFILLAACAKDKARNDTEQITTNEMAYYLLQDCGIVDDHEIGQSSEENVAESNVPGTVLGRMEGSDGKEFSYGHYQGSAFVYEAKSQETINIGLEELSAYAFCACIDSAGTMFFCDSKALWSIKDHDKQLLCRFIDQNFFIDRVDEISVPSDGIIEIKALMDGEEHIIHCVKKEGVLTTLREITIALTRNDMGIERAVAAFNRKNSGYRIVIETPQKNEGFSEFRARIQLEMMNGKGPDLIDNSVLLSFREYAQRGLISPLSDLIDNSSCFIPASLAAGSFRQEIYGIPYQCYTILVAYSKGELGEREYLTIGDLTEILNNSSKSILDGAMDGADIAYYYVLSDKANKDYIDWENGVSHLSEGSFAELLEVIKEHVAVFEPNVSRGKAMAMSCMVTSRSDLNYIKEYFGGDEIILGFPGTNKERNLVINYLLFLNANSQNKDEAKSFIRYIISDENQMELARYKMAVGVKEVTNPPMMPVRLDALSEWLEAEDDSVEKTVMYFKNGITFIDTELTESQKSSFMEAVKKADYEEFGTSQLQDMIYEELTPFFSGEKTAREAAMVLHERIQLYLYENR